MYISASNLMEANMTVTIPNKRRKVRTTITISERLLDRSQYFIDSGVAANRTALIELALDKFLDELERQEIDRQFAAMADDKSYQELNESLAEEFAESDWEALTQTEKEESE
jgi:metal-responsive CopG/Arc/MetJ family transcriptional regulator